MNNIYSKEQIQIIITNPYNSNVIKCINLPSKINTKGGSERVKIDDNILQKVDFSIFDKNTAELSDDNISKIDTVYPEYIGIYPFDTIMTVRDKIYVATRIDPFRQYLLTIDNKGIISSVYSIFISNILIESNLFNSLQKITEDQILNIPIDQNMDNNRNNIQIQMNDNSIQLVTGETYIKKIIVCDLFDILDPNDDNVKNILSNEYQVELIYYGFILKFFPLMTFDVFTGIYITNSKLSLFPLLSPNYNNISNIINNQRQFIDSIYSNIDKSIKYRNSKTERNLYSITNIHANVKIPKINIRNFHDLFELNTKYISSIIKINISGRTYLITKRHFTHSDGNFLKNKFKKYLTKGSLMNTMNILTDDGIYITIYKDTISFKLKFDIDKNITFKECNSYIKKHVYDIINSMNKLNYSVLENTDKIVDMDINIVSTEISVYWPDTYNFNQYELLKKYLQKIVDVEYGNINTLSSGNIEIMLKIGTSNLSRSKVCSIQSNFPNVRNEYEYYTDKEYRNKWNSLTKKTITIMQKISNTGIIMSGFSESNFNSSIYLILSFLYMFSINSKGKTDVTYNESLSLKKLKGVDPELYNIKKYDSNYKVYAVKCQFDKQPNIYTPNEYKSLSKNIQNRLIKFWNFTENKPAYYYCPNKKYPHLSFAPKNHPLGYCLPCCKKLIPSKGSKQEKINQICLDQYKLPHKDINIIINKLEKDNSHLFTYGKDIPKKRLSKIHPTFENDLLNSKHEYRLFGVEQSHNSIDDAGFIFSIIEVLDISMEDFIRTILKNIDRNTYNMIDNSNISMFNDYTDLKEYISNIFLNLKSPSIQKIENIDLINLLSELVYITFNYHIIIITDYDQSVQLKLLNSCQLSLLTNYNIESDKKQNDNIEYIVIFANDYGIYPLVEIDKTQKIIQTKFNKNYNIIEIIYKILKKENDKIRKMGTSLDNIINFVSSNKKYKIHKLLKGKRGLIYAVILLKGNNKIYAPCIYSEFISTVYNISYEFPSLEKYYRSYLYDYIDI